MRFLALALAVVGALAGWTAAGLLADETLGTTPLGVALGVGVGSIFAAALVTIATLAEFRHLAPEVEPEEAAE